MLAQFFDARFANETRLTSDLKGKLMEGELGACLALACFFPGAGLESDDNEVIVNEMTSF